MSFSKLMGIMVFAASSMFADSVVFSFGGTNSSLSLARFGFSPVVGLGSVVVAQAVPSGNPYALSALFSFVTGTRGANDVTATNPADVLNSGGAWTIIGSGTVNGHTFTNELLLGGTFSAGEIANSNNTNAFEGTMVVVNANSNFIAALGIPGIVFDSPMNIASFSRPGSLNVSNGSFNNGTSGLRTPYIGTLTFAVPSTAVPEPVELSFLVAGTLGIAGVLRNRIVRHHS